MPRKVVGSIILASLCFNVSLLPQGTFSIKGSWSLSKILCYYGEDFLCHPLLTSKLLHLVFYIFAMGLFRTLRHSAFVATFLAASILADPTSVECHGGQFGQRPVTNEGAQVAMARWMSSVGCNPGQGAKLITIGLGGRIVHVADGITAQLTTPREVDTQISCTELSASFRAVVEQCAASIGFGGKADNWGIWAAEIGTHPGIGIQPMGRRELLPVATTLSKVVKRTEPDAAVVTPAPLPPTHVLGKRDLTTVVEIFPGITETFELSTPSGTPSVDIAVDPLVNNVEQAFNDLHFWGGFGAADMGYFLRENVEDTSGNVVGGVEMDVTFDEALGENHAFASLLALRDELRRQWLSAPFILWTWRMLGPGNILRASGNFRVRDGAVLP